MPVVTAEIDIDASPQAVWDVVMDPARFGDWVTIHRSVGHVDEGPLREGFLVEQTLALAGAPFKVKWRLAEHDPPWHALWEGQGPAKSRARIVDDLSESRDGGTHFSYRNEFSPPGGPLGAVAGRVLVGGMSPREANRSLERLKRLLEGG